MSLAIQWLQTGFAIWFVLLAAIVLWRMLTGAIDLRGLLRHDPADGVAPERLVTLAAFPTVLVSYVLGALHADMSVAQPSLPDISQNMILLLTGGNGFYLAGKIARS